jgi:carboxylate-amine ligase
VKPASCWPFGNGSAESLRVAFDTSTLSLTLGAEEELMLVDASSGRLVGRIEEALRRVGGDDRFRAELRAAQIEIVTQTWLSAADVGRELALARLVLAEAIGGEVALLASGTHPTAVSLGPITDGPRYHAIARENPWAASHMLTCGLHVHVGLADADRALAVYNALRSYLPELASLAGNSPYHASSDTGLASARLLLNRSLARHGVPPAFPDWRAYAEFVSWGRAGQALPDPSYHWWDLRLHPGHGTVELRVCDVQTDVSDTVALVGLVQTLVAWLAGRYDAGETLTVHDTHRISESLALSTCGVGTRAVLDLESGERRGIVDQVGALVETLAPVAYDLGSQHDLARLPQLAAKAGADRQRQVVRERGLGALVPWLCGETVDAARRFLDDVGVAVGPDRGPAGDPDSDAALPSPA